MSGLFAANTPSRFWRLFPDPGEETWSQAVAAAAWILPRAVQAGLAGGGDLAELVLGEGQFGRGHWRLGPAKRLYYEVKPAIPVPVTRRLRRIHGRLAAAVMPLRWPVEDRFAVFLEEVARGALAAAGSRPVSMIDLWPGGARFALVLTHDVETAAGRDFIAEVADLEESLGFRSSFNLVAGLYEVPPALVEDLRRRGFEVGVHGYRHDGKLFSSHEEFSRRAALINRALRELGAVGFRSPLTHRRPDWMQELEIEYDLSFFDSDPFEPIPGGTMSVWPFQVGAFVELPYTLVQDYTLRSVLGERCPRLWVEKLAFIAGRRGMALLNTHPDYLRDPTSFDIYRAFLVEAASYADRWDALPVEVARWWRARAQAGEASELPCAVVRTVSADHPFGVAPGTPQAVQPKAPGQSAVGGRG